MEFESDLICVAKIAFAAIVALEKVVVDAPSESHTKFPKTSVPSVFGVDEALSSIEIVAEAPFV